MSVAETTEPKIEFNCFRESFEDEAQWLEGRRSVIGASDTAGILGEGYADQSPLTVYESKVNPQHRDEREEECLLVGKDLEPGLLRIVRRKTGLPAWSAGDFTIYRHSEFPWLGATLDGVIEDPEFGLAPLELKNVSNFAFAADRESWEGGEEPPLKFAIQAQHQMAVTGAKAGYVMGLVGGNRPIIIRLPRNDRFIGAMLDKLREFWGYIERRELPPIDASIATGKILAKLFPEDSGETVILPDEADDWIAAWEQAKADGKDADARETAAANQIKAAIGAATFGESRSGKRVSWKQQSRVVKCPKCHDVTSSSSFRVLRFCK